MLCPSVVGRVEELSWLSAGLDALRDGRGGCMFVVGEPGIGKSRLADKAIAEAGRRGAWVLSGRASATGRAVPYQSLSGAVLSGLRARPSLDVTKLQAVRVGLATLLPGFFEGPAIDPSPVLLGETVLRLAADVAGDDGALVVLEDLHWACGDTLAVTEYLADNAATERLLVLGTLRPEGPALDLVDALERRGSATSRGLHPLSFEQMSEMVDACLAKHDRLVPAPLMEIIGARADGMPFLVEELLAGLVTRRCLVATESGWALTGELHDVDVPLSFAQTVRERLAALPDPEFCVLQFAAILGRDFDWTHLPSIAAESDTVVLDALSRAVDLQLVEEVGGDRFRFRHTLTVEAILAEMLGPERLRLAARALDALVPDPERVAPELLELAAHVAAQADRCTDASRYLTEEARRSLARGALATAIATARRARTCVPADQEEARQAAEVLMSALTAAGNSAMVAEVGPELLDALKAHGASRERQIAVQLQLAKAFHAALDLGRARQLCEEALELDPVDPRLQIELDLTLAEIAFSEHQHATAVASAETVLAEADAAGFTDLACNALDLLGRYHLLVTLQLGRAEEYLLASLTRAERAALAPAAPPSRSARGASAVVARVRVLHQLSYLDIARLAGSARIEQARGLADELGLLALVAELDHVLAIHHLNFDQLDAASACAERALEEARRYRIGELAAVVAGIQATIAAMRGCRQEAEERVERVLAGPALGPQIAATVSGSALVLAALADDDLRAATARVAEVRAMLPTERILIQPLFIGLYYGVAAVVLAAAGASELIEGRDWLQIDDVFIHSSFKVAQAVVAGRRGDAQRADELFQSGDEALHNSPWIRAVYRRYAGEAALAGGWGEPARWLHEAETCFADCGNEPMGRACRSLLRLAGASPRRRRTPETDGRYAGLELTTREADVLALLATGLPNKEIADRLYLSPRTVEKHVERILAKTGQANRTALAAYATEHQTVAPAT